MSRNYDNWERLVAAVIKKQQLWELFHAHSRSPSVLSDASDFSSSSSFNDVSLGNWIPYNLQQPPVDKSNNNPALVFISDYEPVFDLKDLLRASPEILGRGTFTSVRAYKLDNGPTIVVKKSNIVNNISEQDFRKHMGMIGEVEHENVAKLRAYYYSKDEKLMIYDYYSGGSVAALLYGMKNGKNRANFPWKDRLRIAVGAARGISYIHTQNGGKLVHGNIKSSNIFLNSQRYGLISDLGFANMILTRFPESSRCYAPEVKHTRNVSQASDVYSFGILLLELLTQKSPHSSLGHEALDLVKLVNFASHKEWTKVFDGDLLLNPKIWEQIVRILEIGISCVAKSPKKRPKMSAVVNMIEDIGMESTGDEVSKLHREDMLFSSDNLLGHGTFGTSYKAILEDGNMIYVKRLKDVTITDEEFQQRSKVIGRMGHKNVADIKAYYYSRDEKFLVYDYYNQGSLSARLHGNRGSGKRALGWNTRLNIAVGVAKGIAHIHNYNMQKLVHGNIRSSNILLNKHQYGIVSDVGMGDLVSPAKSLNAGYLAPEVIKNKKLSQASDVYSFGVVLLELLFAKQPDIMFEREFMSLVRCIDGFVMDGLGTALFDPEVWSSGDVDVEMVETMKIAGQCVALYPEKRPEMTDVVRMLEKIQS